MSDEIPKENRVYLDQDQNTLKSIRLKLYNAPMGKVSFDKVEKEFLYYLLDLYYKVLMRNINLKPQSKGGSDGRTKRAAIKCG